MENEVYGGHHEMVRYVHGLTLRYLRGIRCYHLKNEKISQQEMVMEKLGNDELEQKLNEQAKEALMNVENLCACLG